MSNYRIGIIDEDPADVDYIKRTIYINKPKSIKEEQVDYWEPPLQFDADGSDESIVKNLIEAITDEVVQIIIIDYKIIVKPKTYEGTEIFKKIAEAVPKFPLIMLSNLSEDCYSKEFVDADKVYSKQDFFKIESDYSKEKVANIFRNMDKYISQRSKLSTQLVEQLGRLEKEGFTVDSLRTIVETEKSLDNYTPQNQNTVEKALDFSELKEAVDILIKAQDLIGGIDENKEF